MAAQSWLFRGGIDRERMLDMDRHLQPVRRDSFGVLALALCACGPWLGWWTLFPLVLAGLVFTLADSRMAKAKRPEYVMFAAWSGSQAIIAASIALTGGPLAPTIAWFAIPVVTLSARFSPRGIAAGVTMTLGLILTVAFATDAAAVIKDPPLVIAPIGLVIAVAMLSTALMRSDVEHRNEAVIDPLTGMLNRKALETRTQELTQQSQLSGEPIGIIVGDIDRFKQINDSRGHAVGDTVLTDVAYLLRKRLRAFDLAYRLGGEEFLVLLPGADLQQTAALAEHLRGDVSAGTFAGQRLTMSFGVASSRRGDAFDYRAVFAVADAALYEAKRSGRDRVCGAAPLAAAAIVA
ncbi:MAG TPA: GGDEF domain-containing protein [Solirubrobacteraceae bacterium]|nr:GGDEF domain-containing protein [Solirubrobacteraceae bacterium]